MQADGWNIFMVTGQVDDYLDYRQRSVDSRQSEKKRGEGEHGAECCSDRHGTSDNAYW